MKVRLFEDSVRVRLNQREVMDLGSGRSLHSVTRFGIGQVDLKIRPVSDEGAMQVSFVDGCIAVDVNLRAAAVWSLNDVEGLYAMSGHCKIALEKDYSCLHKTGEANEGTFPHPASLSK